MFLAWYIDYIKKGNDMKTKMIVGSRIQWEKFNTEFKGIVKNVESNADAKTWYKIKITDKKALGTPDRRFAKFRIGQNEFNYVKNMKNLVVLRTGPSILGSRGKLL
jgi:hypothetical protein